MFHASESDEIPGDFCSHRYPFCDVFVMREVRCQFVLRSSEVYSRAQVAGRQRRQFGPADLELFFPAHTAQAELCLAATYWSDWARVGATLFFCHKSAGLLRCGTAAEDLAAVGGAAGPAGGRAAGQPRPGPGQARRRLALLLLPVRRRRALAAGGPARPRVRPRAGGRNAAAGHTRRNSFITAAASQASINAKACREFLSQVFSLLHGDSEDNSDVEDVEGMLKIL